MIYCFKLVASPILGTSGLDAYPLPSATGVASFPGLDPWGKDQYLREKGSTDGRIRLDFQGGPRSCL